MSMGKSNGAWPLFDSLRSLVGPCGRVRARLSAFHENALDSREHARVAVHLASCPACREESEASLAVAQLLRANVPAASAPMPDLWSRIEAEIAPAPTVNPLSVPVTAPSGRVNQWRGFWQSFGPSSALVATCAVVLVWVTQSQKPMPRPASLVQKSVLNAPAAPQITIELRPTFRTNRVAARPSIPQLVAKTVEPKAKIPVRVALLTTSRRTTSVATPRRVLRFVAEGNMTDRRLRPLRATSYPAIASTIAPAAPKVTDSQTLGVASANDTPKYATLVPAPVAPLTEVNHFGYRANVPPSSVAAEPLPKTIVVASADEVMEREVPASLNASDVSERIRRQQTLFSYATYAR